jgi:hypothetical protein
VPRLIDILKTKNENVQLDVAESLEKIGTSEAVSTAKDWSKKHGLP